MDGCAALTHGGFYAHFADRDALVVEALERASAEGAASLTKGGGGLAGIAVRYLSDAHANQPESGCALAALGTETRRQPKAVKAIAARHVRALTSLIEACLPKGEERARAAQARVVLSAMVGAMVIARAVDNAELSKAFRSAAAHFATSAAG